MKTTLHYNLGRHRLTNPTSTSLLLCPEYIAMPFAEYSQINRYSTLCCDSALLSISSTLVQSYEEF